MTILESTLRQHVVTCLRAGGHSLRDRVETPSKNFPITILPFDILDTEGLELKTGEEILLQPGCWILSQEHGMVGQWDANNLTSIWLFEGRPDFWHHLTTNRVIDEGEHHSHLIGFIGNADGLPGWSFTLARKQTVNQKEEIISCYSDSGFVLTPQQQMFMFMDMQTIGMFIAHMARTDLPKPAYALGDYMKPGFSSLTDEMLGVNRQHSIDVGVLSVPDAVRLHVDRTFGDRIPKFQYQHMHPGQVLPIYGVMHEHHDRVYVEAASDPEAQAEFYPGCWVTAPLDKTDAWSNHDLMTFTFVKMAPEYWKDHPGMDRENFLLCMVSNAAGPRQWYYHVPVKYPLHETEEDGWTLLDAVTDFDIDMAAQSEIIGLDLSMISRIGYLNSKKHNFLPWGECKLERPDAESPANWMEALIGQRIPKG